MANEEGIQITLDANKLIERLQARVGQLTAQNIEFEAFIAQQHETIQKLEKALEAKGQEQPVEAEVAPIKRKAN